MTRQLFVLALSSLVSTVAFSQDCPLSKKSHTQAAPASNFVRTSWTNERVVETKAGILETAARAGQFKTLTTAILAAELDGALRGSGPFTVFAPSDAAFAKLPASTVETLLKPENKSKLQEILKYHVVAGKVTAQQAMELSSAKTLLGSKINIMNNSGLMINNAKVAKADIQCSNGIIHVIDTVLLPMDEKTETPMRRENGILATAEKAGNFKTLLTAVKAAGLESALDKDGPYTIFAPTDEAFAKLPQKTLKKLLTPEGKNDLINILTYHVVAGKNVSAKDAVSAGKASTLQGSNVHIDIKNGSVVINNAKTVATDLKTSNGTIHVIDTVLMPG